MDCLEQAVQETIAVPAQKKAACARFALPALWQARSDASDVRGLYRFFQPLPLLWALQTDSEAVNPAETPHGVWKSPACPEASGRQAQKSCPLHPHAQPQAPAPTRSTTAP